MRYTGFWTNKYHGSWHTRIMELGIYIHIPFCRSKCDYCGFYSIPVAQLDGIARGKLFTAYTGKIIREIDSRAPELSAYTVDTIYFGGGTPSLVEPERISRIIGKIRGAFSTDPRGVEITLELNPEDFSPARCEEYIGAGVNRLVLGIQVMDEKLRRVIGRYAPVPRRSVLDGFFSLTGAARCMDLITGIPGQEREDLAREIDVISAYRPEHVSAYMLSIEKGTPLHGRTHNSPELEARQKSIFEMLIPALERAGYRHYEVSNFALPSFESRHNMKYWKYLPYAGFGAAAHSFYGNERMFNSQSVEEYINDPGVRLVHDARSAEARIAEYVMTGMRLSEGISTADFREKLGTALPAELLAEFREMQDEGLVAVHGTGRDLTFRFTQKGFFLMDGLIYRLVEPFV